MGVIYLFYDFNNASTHFLNKKLHVKQISSIEMSKQVYSKAGGVGYITTEDIKLSEVEIENIISWINSVSESEVTKMERRPNNTSIIAGILIGLKFNKEILIQYDLDKIYITKTDINGKRLLYSIDQIDLESFFNEKLKGFYFGEDTINVS